MSTKNVSQRNSLLKSSTEKYKNHNLNEYKRRLTEMMELDQEALNITQQSRARSTSLNHKHQNNRSQQGYDQHHSMKSLKEQLRIQSQIKSAQEAYGDQDSDRFMRPSLIINQSVKMRPIPQQQEEIKRSWSLRDKSQQQLKVKNIFEDSQKMSTYRDQYDKPSVRNIKDQSFQKLLDFKFRYQTSMTVAENQKHSTISRQSHHHPLNKPYENHIQFNESQPKPSFRVINLLPCEMEQQTTAHNSVIKEPEFSSPDKKNCQKMHSLYTTFISNNPQCQSENYESVRPVHISTPTEFAQDTYRSGIITDLSKHNSPSKKVIQTLNCKVKSINYDSESKPKKVQPYQIKVTTSDTSATKETTSTKVTCYDDQVYTEHHYTEQKRLKSKLRNEIIQILETQTKKRASVGDITDVLLSRLAQIADEEVYM